MRRVAAIDVGTNSTHMLVASVDVALGTFSIDLAEKSTTRLGERDPETGELTPEAIARGRRACVTFRSSHSVTRWSRSSSPPPVLCVRPPTAGFLQTIKDQLDLDVDLVSGPEEARLIYLGVLSGMPFGDRPHLVLDIGGGSTELILADGRDARALTSTRVGAVRLQRDFVKDDPIPPQRRSFCRPSFRAPWSLRWTSAPPHQTRKPRAGGHKRHCYGDRSLAASEDERPPLKLHGYKVSRQRLNRVVERLDHDADQRRGLTAINDRRAEIIVRGH